MELHSGLERTRAVRNSTPLSKAMVDSRPNWKRYMKTLILIAGLAGIIVTGAMAQSGPQAGATGSISVTVEKWVSIANAADLLQIDVTDGGYNNYTSNVTTFICKANETYALSATSSVGSYTILTNLDGYSGSGTTPIFYATAHHDGFAATNTGSGSTTHQLQVELVGNPTLGLAWTPAAVTGSVTLTITGD